MTPKKPEPGPNEQGPPTMDPGHWTALLGHWMEFAKAGAALPAGDEWRRAITPVIELQAVTFALADIGTLPEGERAVAVDRAGLQVERNERVISGIWDEGKWPSGVTELVGDAWAAVRAARAEVES